MLPFTSKVSLFLPESQFLMLLQQNFLGLQFSTFIKNLKFDLSFVAIFFGSIESIRTQRFPVVLRVHCAFMFSYNIVVKNIKEKFCISIV